MSPIAVPADRRFRRSHVKPARVRRSWQTLALRVGRYGLIAALLAYALQRVPGMVARTGALNVDRIVVSGNERLSTDEVLALIDGLRGVNLIRVDLDGWRQRLLSSPWISDAELRRSLPSTVEVLLSERRPIGFARIGGRIYLVDERGAVIDENGPHYADLDLPIIDGLSPFSDGAPSVNGPRMELASRVIAALGAMPHVAQRLSQIDVRDLHDAAVILSGDAALIRLGNDQFQQRLQSYLEVAPELHARVANIDQVDARFDGRIYVRPAGRATKAESQGARTR